MPIQINEFLLEETTQLDKNFYTDTVIDFFTKIDWDRDKSWIYGLIWSYWTGKSTMLEEFSKEYKNNFDFVKFDARKYPERKWLLDELILEIIKQRKIEKISNDAKYRIIKKYFDIINFFKDKINQKNRDNEIKRYLCKIEWKMNIPDYRSLLIVFFMIILLISFTWFFTRIDDFGSLIANIVTVIGFGWLIFTIIKERTSNISRIWQFEDLFKEQWKKLEKDTIIILEDVDRSWQEWIYFLETLSACLRENWDNKKKIICICPITNESFEKNYDHYIKCFRSYDDFKVSKIMKNFIHKLVNIEKEENGIVFFADFISALLGEYGYSIRELKQILRKWEWEVNRFIKKYDNLSLEEIFFYRILVSTKYLSKIYNGNWNDEKWEIYGMKNFKLSDSYWNKYRNWSNLDCRDTWKDYYNILISRYIREYAQKLKWWNIEYIYMGDNSDFNLNLSGRILNVSKIFIIE